MMLVGPAGVSGGTGERVVIVLNVSRWHAGDSIARLPARLDVFTMDVSCELAPALGRGNQSLRAWCIRRLGSRQRDGRGCVRNQKAGEVEKGG
ncbi:hypothetical protein GCM10009038_12920 [Salinicola rhizosphaerae]|uniref:Uncharacterized protein n=1 Tax=Salinicola rhizosphaerae TaxID=1443141 RepID=A0ABQ3DTL5_9GAMM|nr:hypothetical protein GCM10009038_12920 [Salinicola rhizosphaerae]